MSIYLILFANFLMTATSPAEAKSKDVSKALKPITFITHEIEPYMSRNMPGDGAVMSTLRTILKKQGYELNVIVAPTWTRAKIDALSQNSIDCLIPVRVRENEDVFRYSEFFFQSPWVIIERKDKPIKWNKPEELKGLVAGNIQGVELRPGVQELIDKNILRLESAPNAVSSLLQLANRRVDFVFADPFVFTYAMETEEELARYIKDLQINSKPWYVEKYGVACKKNLEPQVVASFYHSAGKFKRDMEDYLKFVIADAKLKKQKKQ